MGQKVNPIGFRLGLTEPHKSQWFARFSKYKYSQSVLEDHMLRKTLKKTLNHLFLQPLYSASHNTTPTRQDFEEKMPVINNITIERKFIPYQVIVSIHAQDCHLFKKQINKLKVNRELIAKMLKVRAFRFNLRNKINNLNIISKKDQDPVFQNQVLDMREKRLKKRQKIRFIYRQRIAKDFIVTKKGNTIIQKLNLKKQINKKLYLPLKYKLNSRSLTRTPQKKAFLEIKKAYGLKKQRKNWFKKFPRQVLTPYPEGRKILKMKIKKRNYFFKNKNYFSFSKKSKKKYLLACQILKKNFKNSSKNINTLRRSKNLTKKTIFTDAMFNKSKKIFHTRLFGNEKKIIQLKNSFDLRIKKRFVRIFLNKISVKFTRELKENYQNWYSEMIKNKNGSPFTFLKKWRFAKSPMFFTLLNTLKTITKKKQFSLDKDGKDISEVVTLLTKIQNYFVPLKKVLATLKKKIRFKFLALRKEFIAFGSISQINKFAFYQVLYYFNYLNKFVNELNKIYSRQLSIYKFDMDNNINGDIINMFAVFFQTNKKSTNLIDKLPNLVKQKNNSKKLTSQTNKTTMQSQTNSNYIDLSDGNLVTKLKKNVPSKVGITQFTRRMKLVEYIKDIIKKHRTENLYFYLPIISEARQKIRQNNKFIKLKSKALLGSKINSFLKENILKKKSGSTKETAELKSISNDSIKKELTPQLNQILKKTWNLKLEETKETACLLKLRSILQEQQRLRKTIELKSKVRINFFNINKEIMETKASVVCETIVENLEKREAFRKVIKSAQKKVMKAKGNIKGIKIQVSGRLNGAEIARTEWVKAGRVPLQSLSSNIDYAYRTANTLYGIIGIKVWIFKGYKKVLGYKKIKN